MTCTICKKECYALISGLCASCDERFAKEKPKPKPKTKKKATGRRSSKAQKPRTRGLRMKCMTMMHAMDLPPYKFADSIGITRSAFYRWINGEFTEPKQDRFNDRLESALSRVESELKTMSEVA